jgi:hypothetical protein
MESLTKHFVRFRAVRLAEIEIPRPNVRTDHGLCAAKIALRRACLKGRFSMAFARKEPLTRSVNMIRAWC